MTQVSDAAYPIGGEPFQVGRALSRIFEVYAGGFVKFTLISFVVLLPILLIKLAILSSMPPTSAPGAVALAGLLIFPLTVIVHGACMLGAFKLLRGEGFDVSQSLGAAARRFFPLLGVGLVAGLGTMLGAMLLVVPGLIIAVMWYVAGVACLVEKAGVFDSLRRSSELTKGYRWPIFGVLLIIILLSMFGSVGFVLVAKSGASLLLRSVVEFIWSVIVGGFGAVIVGVVYHDLRVAKEGVDIEKLTSVFE